MYLSLGRSLWLMRKCATLAETAFAIYVIKSNNNGSGIFIFNIESSNKIDELIKLTYLQTDFCSLASQWSFLDMESVTPEGNLTVFEVDKQF